MFQKKFVIWGCYLIEFGEFFPKNWNLPSPSKTDYPLEGIYYT